MTEFQNAVAKALKKVQIGKTVSYQELADLAGHPRAYRAVANFCKSNWEADIPCHRVVHSDGRVGKYNRSTALTTSRDGGEATKIKRLENEGVKIIDGYVQDKKYKA